MRNETRYQYWHGLYESYVRSDLSAREFCRRRRLNYGTLTQAFGRYDFSLTRPPKPSSFIELTESSVAPCPHLEVSKGELSIKLLSQPTAEELQTLVAVLEGEL